MTSPKRVMYAKALAAALGSVQEKRAKERIRNFLVILKKRGDSKHLPQILREFHRLWQEAQGTILEVVSAEPLSKNAKKQITKEFRRVKFLLKETVNPGVVAGVGLFIGRRYLFDGTVREKLRRMFTV